MNYIKNIMEKYPPFVTIEDEKKMINEHLSKGDTKGMQDELVLRNVGLITTIGKSWIGFYTGDELASYGIEGLIRASKSFDVTRNVKFSTYASRAIRTYLSNNKTKKRSKIDEVSVSMDIPIDDGIENSQTIRDVIESKIGKNIENVKTPSYETEKSESENMMESLIDASGFSEKQKNILVSVFYDNMSQVDVSKKYNISRQRVNQILDKMMTRLRQTLFNGEFSKVLGISQNVSDGKFDNIAYKKMVMERFRSIVLV